MALTSGTTGHHCTLGDPEFEQRYRAIDARDSRFDGQFFTAVSSTGIYCRPSCPARTPKPQNVAFYLTSAAAHTAGYRACKRCLPEASPGSPEWNLRGDVTSRVMRLIADGVVDRGGVEALAGRVGYTSRHLRRFMNDELGASPVALSRARRAQAARSLLVETELPMAQVAFAAGFGSIRQFNDTVREVFDSSPRELRGLRGQSAAVSGLRSESSALRLELALPLRHPFDAPGIFRFLATRAIAGIEAADVGSPHQLRYARTLGLPHGPGAVDIQAVLNPRRGWEVRLSLEVTALADVAPAVTRVRRLLDLDADPMAVDTALSHDPHLAPLVAGTPGIRVPGAVDPHELLVRAIVGQQISVVGATGHLARLTEVAGDRWNSSIPGLNRLFPTARQIVENVPLPLDGEPLDPSRPLRLPTRSVKCVVEACKALVEGDLEVDVGADPSEMRAQLLAQRGIGPWTAAYVAMRVLGDPDAWPPDDVALVAGAKVTGILDETVPKAAAHRDLIERASAWAPWRSHAAMHLWQAANPTLDPLRSERPVL